jgi:2-oxoglutarate dehydrogenase E2 component (dihydrolipoamide succinyltransferase)
MAVEVKVPNPGESITEVQIGEWLKGKDEHIHQDENLVELETDKASMELPAPASGRIIELRKKPGEVAEVGEVIAIIDETDPPPADSGSKKKEPAASATSSAKKTPDPQPAATAAPSNGDGDPRVMPAAQRLLAQHDLEPGDVTGTGPGGRILKEDVERVVLSQTSESSGSKPATGDAGAAAADHVTEALRAEEVVPMTMMRRRIAEHMLEAQHNAALLTTFNEIDMSRIMELRSTYKDRFEKRYGVRLGFMSVFIKAAVDALKLVPEINAEIREKSIVYRNYYDVGVAVSTDKGLVVPIIRNAERLSLAEIEQTIGDFATRARANRIELKELQGGTFTITNGGVFGSLMSTPIVNPPQSGVLGMHAIQDRPVAVDGQVVIRPMMYVALTYDHRIVDGRGAVTFLKRIKECVEEPTRMLIEV